MRNRGRSRNRGRRLVAFGSLPGVAPWTPASLPSIALWCTPAPTWCFTDSAGTSPCGDGDLIRRWNDRSGNARNLLQGTSANRPTLVSVGGGKWVAQFDGVNDFMQVTFGVTLAQPVTYGYAINLTGSAATQLLLDGVDGTNRINAAAGGSGAAGKMGIFAGTLLESAEEGRIKAAWETVANGASSAVYKAGVSVAAGDAGANGLAGLTVGARFSGTFAAGVDVYDCVVQGAAISAPDLALLVTYHNALLA